MPIPLLLALPAAAAAITELCATVGGAWAAAGMADAVIDGVSDWWDSPTAWGLMTDRLNAKLQSYGIEIEFPPFNPMTTEGQDIAKAVIEGFALDRINAKTGASFTSLADLNQDTFLQGVGGVLASRINQRTGSDISSVWPVEKLKDQLHTEAIRQFDNRGRYAGGTLFKGNLIASIKEKIASKHPDLMKQVKAVENGGEWGPPMNEAHRKRREKGKARQLKYRQSHQQVWRPKNLEG